MKNSFLPLLIGAAFVTTAWADKIELKDGSIIIGKLEKRTDEKIQFKPAWGSTLEIPTTELLRLEMEEPAQVATQPDAALTGTVRQDAAGILITPTGENAPLRLAPGTPYAIWTGDAPNPLAPLGRVWTRKLALGLGGKTGNSEQFGWNGAFAAVLAGPIDTLTFNADGNYVRTDGNTSSNDYLGKADYERLFVSQGANGWYTRAEWEKDRVQLLDWAGTIGGGLAHYFFNDRTDFDLRFRGGLAYREEHYTGSETNQSASLDFRGTFVYNFSKTGKWVTDVVYMPAIDDPNDNYLFTHESKLELKIANAPDWFVQFGVNNQYNNQPAEDAEKLDTTYFTRLGREW